MMTTISKTGSSVSSTVLAFAERDDGHTGTTRGRNSGMSVKSSKALADIQNLLAGTCPPPVGDEVAAANAESRSNAFAAAEGAPRPSLPPAPSPEHAEPSPRRYQGVLRRDRAQRVGAGPCRGGAAARERKLPHLDGRPRCAVRCQDGPFAQGQAHRRGVGQRG